MPHLDDAALHSYLDGEDAADEIREKNIVRHLAACAECRARLEQARVLRERAAAVLAGAAPEAIPAPPFQTLVRRAEAEAAPAARRAWRVRPIAAAAVLVLAVAAGWTMRGLLGTGTAPMVSRPAVTPPIVAATPPRPEPRTAPSTVEQPAARQGAGGPPTVAETPVEAAEQRVTVAADQAGRRDEARALEQADIPTPRDVVAPAPALAVAPAEPAAREVWTTVGGEAARQYLGADLVLVPELSVLSYATGTWDGEPAVRVIQALTGTDTLELILTRVVETEQARAREAVASRAVRLGAPVGASVVRGNLRILGRGPMGPDSLNALLARIPTP